MFQALEPSEQPHNPASTAGNDVSSASSSPAAATDDDLSSGSSFSAAAPRPVLGNAPVQAEQHAAGEGVAELTLDALLALPASRLQSLYRQAEVPALEALAGDLRGRMLDNVLFGGPVARWLAAFAATDVFPWRGKSFAAYASDAGEGINRIFSDRLRRFGFSTFVGRSRAGSFDAVQLDYDRPENPWVIRMVKDEIRQLRPGLYLGQAYFAYPHEQLVLYFGLTSDGVGGAAS